MYFHAIEEGRESANRNDLERLFSLADLPIPKNLSQLLVYLAGKGKKLNSANGEFSLRRDVRQELDQELRGFRGLAPPFRLEGGSAFDFPGRIFADAKINALLQELKKCYPKECWNACGLLIRIIIERTLDAIDAGVRSKTGLEDKINACRSIMVLSKSLREALGNV